MPTRAETFVVVAEVPDGTVIRTRTDGTVSIATTDPEELYSWLSARRLDVRRYLIHAAGSPDDLPDDIK